MSYKSWTYLSYITEWKPVSGKESGKWVGVGNFIQLCRLNQAIVIKI